MSVDFEWIVAAVRPEDAGAVERALDEALTAVDWARWHEERQLWATNPDSLLPREDANGQTDFSTWHAFGASFVPAPICAVWNAILEGTGALADVELSEDATRLVMANGVPPASALAYALGAGRVDQLPGRALTFFVPPRRIAELRATWERLAGGAAGEAIRERIERWLTRTIANDPETALEIMNAIPDVAELAARRGHGLLAVSAVWTG